MSEPIIRFNKLNYSYGKNEVLHQINLQLLKGNQTAIVGPSGCGKTTLLYLAGGLLKGSPGQVQTAESRESGSVLKTSFMFQEDYLLPWKNIIDNVSLALAEPSKNVKKKAAEILESYGLGPEKHKRFPSQLSGGERQRAALARVMITKPDLLLLDEPFSSLDELTRENMNKLLKDVISRDQLSVLLVTHNLEEALYFGKEILIMKSGRIAANFINSAYSLSDVQDNPEFYRTLLMLRRVFRENAK